MNFIEKVVAWFTGLGAGLLSNVLKAVIIAAAGYLIIRLAMQMIDKFLEKSKLERTAHNLIRTLAKTVMYILLALIVASALGIDVTGIVALASVATLAVSLALQNMLADLIGGFTLLYTHPFKSGDYVEVAGQSGTVQEVGMAYTKLTTPDNKVVSIPNSAVVAAEIVNYSTTGTRRLEFSISASYNAPAEKVIAALLKAVEDDRVMKDPAPFAALAKYGESAIEYTLRVWTTGENYWPVNYDVNTRIKKIFDAEGIEMTYPHLNVHLDK